MQGFLLLNKPKGKTSFGAVAYIRKLAGEKRVGHTGTLDPLATGVLPVFLGRATALSSYLLDADKEYEAEITLGVTTDTCDITGEVIRRQEVNVNSGMIEKALEHFKGEISQTPPMYSAIKKDGVRLYELARKGIETEIPSRKVTVFESKVISPLENNKFKVKFTVSKGTYIRSLCRDIGEYLGCGATLSELCRTSVSGFGLNECARLEDLNSDNISQFIISEENAVLHLPQVNVTEKQAVRFCNGGQLDFDRLKLSDKTDGLLFRVKCGDLFLGIGQNDSLKGQLAVKCVINKF